MGDVLTGTIAGILAQCRETWLAARVGVLVHAMAPGTKVSILHTGAQPPEINEDPAIPAAAI